MVILSVKTMFTSQKNKEFIQFSSVFNAKIMFIFQIAVRSTSWRGGENEQGGGPFNADGTGGGGPPRLERSKSTQGSLPNREGDSALGPKRRLIGANASWDEDNLPEWYVLHIRLNDFFLLSSKLKILSI